MYSSKTKEAGEKCSIYFINTGLWSLMLYVKCQVN